MEGRLAVEGIWIEGWVFFSRQTVVDWWVEWDGWWGGSGWVVWEYTSSVGI